MEENKRLILLCNDDGYHAKGINALADMVKDFAYVLVCAPDSARSGFGCAFSATQYLLLKKRRQWEWGEMWSCNGTPVDCVKMALSRLCPRQPDLIIGGINHGDNSSVNVHYSGTVGVALEGAMKYIPSLAFSLCDYADDADFEPLRPYVRKMVERVLREGMERGVCLNVNFPATSVFRGVRVCRMAAGTWFNETVKCGHPRGYDYYWMVGEYKNDEPQAEDTDRWALEHGYVAVTPTRIDVTSYEAMAKLTEWQE